MEERLPWSSSSSSNTSATPPSSRNVKEVKKDGSSLKDVLVEDQAALLARLSSIPPHILGPSTFAIGITLGLGAQYLYARYLRRIPNAEWVTPDMLVRRRWIKGYVTRCSLYALCPPGARSLRWIES